MAVKKEMYNDDQIIQGILQHDRKILKALYAKYYPMIEKVLKADGADKEDAWDVFQEAISALYNRIISEGNQFALRASFSSFFVAICKNIWYKHLRRKRLDAKYVEEAEALSLPDIAPMEEQIKTSIMLRLLWRNVQKLKPSCQKIVLATINGMSSTEQAKLNALGSVQAFYNKRRKCIEKLFNLIKNDPDYFILKDYEKP